MQQVILHLVLAVLLEQSYSINKKCIRSQLEGFRRKIEPIGP